MRNIKYRLSSLLLMLSTLGYAQERLTQRLDSLTKQYEAAGFHGVILLAKSDEVIYENAFGFADLEKRITMTPNKLFKTESIGKMFTSTRIMQLFEGGKLSLTQTIADYLPDWKINNADRITIHQLLNHTSGLMSPWDDATYNFKKIYTTEELKGIIESQPLAFNEPGSRFHYSNSAYIILGEIIARLEGKPFEQIIRENIFNVSGLKKINHLGDTIMPAEGAQPYYFYSSKDYVKSNETLSPQANAAGGWVTTAEELLKFVQAYMRGDLISSNTQKIQQSANYSLNTQLKGSHYGYGVVSITNDRVPNKTIVGHNGGGAGFSIDAFFEPESKYAIVMCSNMYGTGYTITANYFNLLFDQPTREVRQSNLITLVDYILEKGSERGGQNLDSFFKQSGITPKQELLVNASEHLMRLEKFESAADVLIAGTTLLPNAPYIWLKSGDVAMERKLFENAREFYYKAATLAKEQNNNQLYQAGDNKLRIVNELLSRQR